MSNLQTTPLKQYKREELPATVTLTLDHGSSSFWGGFLMVVGGAITLTGAGFIIFGPDTIYYNTYSGMSFMQFLQAYPGPIATIGFALLALGQLALNNQINKENEQIALQIENHLAFSVEDLPDNERLYVHPLGDDQFEVGIEEIEVVDNVSVEQEEAKKSKA